MNLVIQRLGLILAIMALTLVQYRLWFDDSGLLASRALQADIQQIRDFNQQQEVINDKLLRDVKGLRAGGSLVEEYAREELGLIKSNESFILILDKQ